jgi:hypothetical protein
MLSMVIMRTFATMVFGWIYFHSEMWEKAVPPEEITTFQSIVLLALGLMLFFTIIGYENKGGD